MDCSQCNELYRVGRLDWREEHVRGSEHRRACCERELHTDVFGSRRFGGADGVCCGSGGRGADSDACGVAGERDLGRFVAIDVVRDQCNELHRFRWLDRCQEYVGDTGHGRADGECKLHPHVHRERRLHRADGSARGDDACTHREHHRIADQRAIGHVVTADLEHDERDELFGVGCLVGG